MLHDSSRAGARATAPGLLQASAQHPAVLGAPASYHLMTKSGAVLMNTVDYAAEQAMVDPLARQALPELVVVFGAAPDASSTTVPPSSTAADAQALPRRVESLESFTEI